MFTQAIVDAVIRLVLAEREATKEDGTSKTRNAEVETALRVFIRSLGITKRAEVNELYEVLVKRLG